MPTSQWLRKNFTYKDGQLLAKKSTNYLRTKGNPIGGVKGNGYHMSNIGRGSYYTHRLIWTYFNGPIAEGLEIDHINRNPVDNRISNLRLVTRSQNNFNQSLRSNNKSGHRGVGWCATTGKWRARIKVDKSEKFLGYFDDKADAIIARQEAERELGIFSCAA